MTGYVTVCRVKINRARVTGCNLNYDGSLAVDQAILERAGIVKNERVVGVNISTGARFETYAIAGKPGEVALHGGTARLGSPGDIVGMLFFISLPIEDAAQYKTRIIILNEKNEVTEDYYE